MPSSSGIDRANGSTCPAAPPPSETYCKDSAIVAWLSFTTSGLVILEPLLLLWLNLYASRDVRPAVIAFTGLRRGELCALRWRWIDFEAQTLHVGRNVQRTAKGRLTIEAPKTERSRRTIPIDAGLVAELRRHKAAQAAFGLQLGIAQTEDWLLFPHSPDQPTELRSPNGFAQALTRHLEKRASQK